MPDDPRIENYLLAVTLHWLAQRRYPNGCTDGASNLECLGVFARRGVIVIG